VHPTFFTTYSLKHSKYKYPIFSKSLFFSNLFKDLVKYFVFLGIVYCVLFLEFCIIAYSTLRPFCSTAWILFFVFGFGKVISY